MRVLQVIDSLRIGGAEVLLGDLVPRFLQRGIDCEVLVLSRSSSPIELKLQEAGVKLIDTGNLDVYSPRQIFSLAKCFHSFDLAHVHLFPAQLWAALAALPSSFPLVTTEHSTWNARRHWWFRPLDAFMYSRYAQIACIGDAAAAELVRWCPSVKPRLRIVPNGIVVERFSDASPAVLAPVGDGMIRAVFVGRLDPLKDHPTLLRALTRAPRIHLLLLGDGPLRRGVEDLARELGIADRVTFMGFRTDVPQILKACDIYVHSAISEGFGIAACEAMAARLPVIATDLPALAQLVQGAGILTPPRDFESLARALNALADSPGTRARMADASRLRAQDFSIDRTVDGYVQMYESVSLASAK
jgi:glycosyltransferase involved in cell wall biosynthesis